MTHAFERSILEAFQSKLSNSRKKNGKISSFISDGPAADFTFKNTEDGWVIELKRQSSEEEIMKDYRGCVWER